MKKVLIFMVMLLISLVATGCSGGQEIIGIAISSNENVRTIVVGEEIQLTAVVYPEEVPQEVVWSSEDSQIATVNEQGLVTGVKAGRVGIVATSQVDENIKQTFTIIVETAPAKVIDPESITVSSVSGSTTCKVGQTLSLTAIVLPREASQSVTWKTSDATIATVSRGDVKALKVGSVTITATAKSFDTVYGSITITIEAADKPVVSGEWSEMSFSSHNDYVTCDDDTKLKIKGVVTHVCPEDENTVSYFIQNGNDGYYVYSQDSISFPVEEGKVYEVGGYKKYYRGLNEIVNVEYCVESSEDITFNYQSIENENPTSLDDMKVYQAAYVTGKGIFVSGGPNGTKAFNIVVKVNGYDTTLRIDPSYAGSEEFAQISTLVSSAIAGLEVEFKGFMIAFGYGTPSTQIQIVKASDLSFQEAQPEDILAACSEKLTVIDRVGFSKATIELPSSVEGFDDVVITWKSNNELINVTTKEVSHSEEDEIVTLTATLTLGSVSIEQPFDVLVQAADNNLYETVVKFDLEDALPATQYGCSDTKPGYAEGNVILGTPKCTWLLRNALIACSESDKYEGTMGIRAKAGSDAASTARIEILNAGEYNVVEFAAATYGSHVLGSQIRVEYTTDNGRTWIDSGELITLNSHSLETFRVKLPEGSKRIAIVVVENSGKTINIDSINLMK